MSRRWRPSRTSARRSPPATPTRSRRTAAPSLVDFDIRGDKDEAVDKIDPVLDGVATAQRAHPGFFIGEFGDASAQKAVDTAFGDDLGKAGTLSLPITLIILVLTFGALVAAGIPLLLGLTAVFATFGLVALPSQLLPMAQEAPALVLLIGLAVGVDYSMFYLKRERAGARAGRSERAALEAAAATSGRSVLISGLTVMVAMAGMFLTGDKTFASFGVATILVVAVAVLGLAHRPARRCSRGSATTSTGCASRSSAGSAATTAKAGSGARSSTASCAGPRCRRSSPAGCCSALAVPALQLQLAAQAGRTRSRSRSRSSRRTTGCSTLPGHGAARQRRRQGADVQRAGGATRRSRELEQRALASGRACTSRSRSTSTRTRTVANITLPIEGTEPTPRRTRVPRVLRKTIVPETVGALPNAEAGVTGLTAQWKDRADEMKSDAAAGRRVRPPVRVRR